MADFNDVKTGGSSEEITEEEKAMAANTVADLDEMLVSMGRVEPKTDDDDDLLAKMNATSKSDVTEEEAEQAEARASEGQEEPEEVPEDEPEEILEESSEEQETLDSEDGAEETPAEEDEASAGTSEVDDRLAELNREKEKNAGLMKMLNDQQAIISQAEAPAPAAVPEPIAPVPTPAPVAQVPASVELTDEHFLEIISSKEAFQKHMAAEISSAVQMGVQQVLSQVPDVVTSVTEVQNKIQGFFGRPENKDVLPLMDYVVKNAGTIEGVEPGLSVHEVLTKSSEQVREALGLERVKDATIEPDGTVRVPQKRKGGNPKPSAAQKFAKTTSRRAPQKPVKRRSGITDEIEEMNRLFG